MMGRRAFFGLVGTLLNLSAGVAYGQIAGGINLPCSSDQVDAVAICVSHVICTHPPNPLDAFDIGARSFATCPNQPVDNFASVDGKVGGVQAIATAQAKALFFNRLIHQEIRGGDCSGNAPLLTLFDDPQGCNPPPPPPPPVADGCLGGSDPSNPPDTGGSVAPNCSPIIVDTEGEGFHLTSAENGVTFDIQGDGHPLRIAWTAHGSRNAFLALDRNGDGIINNGTELFGNFTVQDSSARRNGFLALAEFDERDQGGNGDGIIDEHDAVFSKLRLWIDENHDGICQPGELHTLAELGVFSIALDYEISPKRDQYGNQFRYKARINPGKQRDRRDETSEVGRWTYDVFLTAKEK